MATKTNDERPLVYLPDAQTIVNTAQIAALLPASDEAAGGRVIIAGARSAIVLTTGDRAVLLAHVQEHLGNPLALPEA